VPKHLTDSGTVSDITNTYTHGLALLSNGSIFAWTSVADGILRLPDRRTAVKVVATSCKILAILDDQSLVAWSPECQSTAASESPAAYKSPETLFSNVVDVAVVQGRVLVAHAHDLFSFDLYQLGSRTFATEEEVSLPLGSAVKQIAPAGPHLHGALVLTTKGEVLAFGNSTESQLNVPVQAQAGGIIKIGAGFGTAYALLSSGQLVIWGEGFYNTSKAAQLSGVVDFAAGEDHLVVLLESGEAWAYGSNQYGQVRHMSIESA
jgi:hypothetical protein